MLAALLIDANNIGAMERLVAVMWDTNAPATAVRQVQDAVSGLRRNLVACGAPGSLISTRHGGYEIHLAQDQLDLLEFDHQRHLAEQHTAPLEAAVALRRALACWRGNALVATPSQALEIDAARLNEKRAATHKQCLAIELDLGRHREVIDELTDLLREHPYDEQVAEHLMVALYRCRRQGEAQQVYEALRRTLADELGVDPTPPLRALHQRILTADPALAATIPANGPSVRPPESPAPVAPGPAMAKNSGMTEVVPRLAEIEADVQGFVEAHMETLLGVRFLASQYGTGPVHGGRIDSIGLDENGSPVIAEYKRGVDAGVINQGLCYLAWLMDHRAEFEHLVRDRLGVTAASQVLWSGPRLICIAGDFTRYDVHAVREHRRSIDQVR